MLAIAIHRPPIPVSRTPTAIASASTMIVRFVFVAAIAITVAVAVGRRRAPRTAPRGPNEVPGQLQHSGEVVLLLFVQGRLLRGVLLSKTKESNCNGEEWQFLVENTGFQ